MKVRPYSVEHIREFETMTKHLSIAAKGVWIAVRMLFAARKEYVFAGPSEALGWLIGCPSDVLLTSLKEFELKPCGYRVEWPPCNGDGNGSMVTPGVMRLVWAQDEQADITLTLNSFRVSKYRESKKISEYKRMPEHYELTEKMKSFGMKHGMTEATVMHEFERYKAHHSEKEWTDKGWEILVWTKWVLNWISYGRKQITSDVWA
jgi:hypothetical protein